METSTCQCRQLKLNPLSTQINIHCLMTNQTPAFLIQRAARTRAAVTLLQSLYFAPPPSELWSPTPAPSVHLKIKIAVTVRSGISKRSHEKWRAVNSLSTDVPFCCLISLFCGVYRSMSLQSFVLRPVWKLHSSTTPENCHNS